MSLCLPVYQFVSYLLQTRVYLSMFLCKYMPMYICLRAYAAAWACEYMVNWMSSFRYLSVYRHICIFISWMNKCSYVVVSSCPRGKLVLGHAWDKLSEIAVVWRFLLYSVWPPTWPKRFYIRTSQENLAERLKWNQYWRERERSNKRAHWHNACERGFKRREWRRNQIQWPDRNQDLTCTLWDWQIERRKEKTKSRKFIFWLK